MSMKYRSEIDGLRALAVIAVILYHAKWGIQGGFIGVDIFFVISGYLITSIILREMQEGTFSLISFYERRARRILPALLIVMLFTLPPAWFLMLPDSLSEYAKSVLAALGFASNVWFSLEDTYTAQPSLLKPMLHTWTLAVEEQFYILFPLLLMMLTAFLRRYILSLFVLGLLVSLQIAESAGSLYPNETFYLLHTRVWELLAGAMIAKIEMERPRENHPLLEAIMPALGICLIAHALIFFEDTMRHPSFMTALPVIGTMLLLWFCKKGELITDLLSARPLVIIGLISYSLYLWHFPIFAFARIEWGDLTTTAKLACIILTFILSALSYSLIERPIRYKMALKPFLAVILIATVILIGVNAFIIKTGGAKFRMAAYNQLFEVGDADMRIDGIDCFARKTLGEHCKFTHDGAKGTIIGIGDSHLAMFGPALKSWAEKHNMNYEQFPNCVFILGTQIQKPDGALAPNPCPEEQLAALAKYKNAIIVKATRLTWRITGTDVGGGIADHCVREGGDDIKDAIIQTNEQILAHGHTLIQIYPVPELDFSPAHTIKTMLRGHEMDYKSRLPEIAQSAKLKSSLVQYHQRHTDAFEALDKIENPNYIKIHPHKILCDETLGTCDTFRGGHILYRDMNHLTPYAAKLIVSNINL